MAALLFNNYYRLLDSGVHCDVEFVVHGHTFRAHRCILTARSQYFANMFETRWKDRTVISLKHNLVRLQYV